MSFFSSRGFKEAVNEAREILDKNWAGRYTKPSPNLYPHQWNWDSCFIAIGYSHYNEERAMVEILSLFSHQWENGMIPQIAFNPHALGNYFPEPDFWQVPGGKLTSGITMPPLHASACLHIYQAARNKKKAREFLESMFPKLMASHRYFYTYRDPQGSGLVYIRHPWESGLDNSPSWDKPLCHMEIDKSALPQYERKDLKHGVPKNQRPSDEDYDRYVYLVDLFRRMQYEEEKIFAECPFLIQDVLFNSILCRANHDLAEIGRIVKQDTGEAEAWAALTSRAIRETLWSEERRQFEPRDLISNTLIPSATASGFMPLYAGAASAEQAELLYARINSLSFCALHQGNCFTIPNFDMGSEAFDSKNYWRGPVWININWMLSHGLKRYGYREKADMMKKDLLQLPIRFGFHEYFDSITGKGYGSSGFSWTAALFIDLYYEYYRQDSHSSPWTLSFSRKRLKQKYFLNKSITPSGEVPSLLLAARLMEAIGHLRETFYDMTKGVVDYSAMKNSPDYFAYKEMAACLDRFDLTCLKTREEKLAFWINLYNTIVIQGIIELEITASVREIPNFFSHICYKIGGHPFSPKDIEHGILRANRRPPYRLFPPFRGRDPRLSFSLKQMDPRIHFALVCGSRSCAPIQFYDAETIDEQLDIATQGFINSSEVIVLPEKNRIMLSQIFNWYAGDFGTKEDRCNFLLKYLYDDDKKDYLRKNRDTIEIAYLFYDWNLNH